MIRDKSPLSDEAIEVIADSIWKNSVPILSNIVEIHDFLSEIEENLVGEEDDVRVHLINNIDLVKGKTKADSGKWVIGGPELRKVWPG